MSSVEFLLSSYNGELYLTEQLRSLSAQTYSDWSVRIRDDGSTDRTVKIIEVWQAEEPPERSFLEKGANLGVVSSFFELLCQADESSEYFAFCDQDDVWLPEKTERAVRLLHAIEPDVPAMVFTPTRLTDERLRPLGHWPASPPKPPSFYNALYQNIAVGATITFNRAALRLLRRHRPDPRQVLMHDWWLYLCVSAFGTTIYDPEPSILYRQHGNNAVGGELSIAGRFKRKWASFRRHRGSGKLVAQAKEFHRLYGPELSDSKKAKQLELFIAERPTFKSRMAYLRSCRLYRQSRWESLLFRVLVLTGYL